VSQSAVSITSACVVLRGQTVLEGAQLSVDLGTTVGIVGPNGSGKSTLLRLIVGLVHPDHGTVRVLGGSPSDVAVLRRLGAAIDTPALYPWMSGRTTLRMFLSLAGEADEGRSERALDRFDLAGAGRKPVARYSQGMRKRLALAVASVRRRFDSQCVRLTCRYMRWRVSVQWGSEECDKASMLSQRHWAVGPQLR